MAVNIEELQEVSGDALDDVNRLLRQLDETAQSLTQEELENIVAGEDADFFVVRDGERIIGMGTLVELRSTIGHRARIEDVVVDETYRGQGLGKQLTETMITRAREKGIILLELSSRPSREAANALYQKIGFVRKETNVYVLRLQNGKR